MMKIRAFFYKHQQLWDELSWCLNFWKFEAEMVLNFIPTGVAQYAPLYFFQKCEKLNRAEGPWFCHF